MMNPVPERASLRTRWTRWRAEHPAWLRTVAFVIVALAAFYSNVKAFEAADRAHDALVQAAQEGNERRDQICQGAEQTHEDEVNQLVNTYRYVLNLPPDELKTTFNRFIIAQIPKTETDAKSDEAPDFCDEPGVAAETLYKKSHGRRGAKPIGLPEPDPVVPERPARIDKLIRETTKQQPTLTRHK